MKVDDVFLMLADDHRTASKAAFNEGTAIGKALVIALTSQGLSTFSTNCVGLRSSI